MTNAGASASAINTKDKRKCKKYYKIECKEGGCEDKDVNIVRTKCAQSVLVF
jgi:hypothetical protein